jgi:hypothetical protein
MFILVILANFLLGSLCLVAARQVWLARFKLRSLGQTLDRLEQTLHRSLAGAPQGLTAGALGLQQLRGRYHTQSQAWVLKLEQSRHLWRLLILAQRFWQGRRWVAPRQKRR